MRSRFGCGLRIILLISLLAGCQLGGQEAAPYPLDASPTLSSSGDKPDSPPFTSPSAGDVDPWDLWSSGTQLRGANIYQRKVYPELDGDDFMGTDIVGPLYIQDDFEKLAELGANYVNISHPGLFSERPPYALDEGVQVNLDRLLEMIAQADMFAVIAFRTGPGRSEFTFHLEDVGDWFDASYLNDDIWIASEAQDAWVEMWRYTAERYKDNPILVGYDLMVEPNANEVFFDEWDPQVFQDEYGGTTYDWNQLFPRVTDAIREVDAETPILVGGMGYSAIEWLTYLEPSGDPRTVYTAHQYAPMEYTHQEFNNLEYSYPDAFDTDWDGQPDAFNRGWLDNLLSTADAFSKAFGVPVAVNEFGIVRWVPGAAAYMDDLMDLMEERGLNHALWAWEVSWEPWVEEVHAFNFRLGVDPSNNVDLSESELLGVIKKYWGRNTVRPSNRVFARSSGVGEPQDRLEGVEYWLYLIDVNLNDETIEQIVNSNYDMVVLDYIPSEAENRNYPMAEVIAGFHRAERPKLVLAYIDIGEAESYRSYWQANWEVGDPEWIAGEDPDGWAENYPVAYWRDEWKEIWLREGGLLQGILEAGFDGVYLDWVEAYSDENVIELAEIDGVDPVREMIRWVADISGFVSSRCGECVVIAQNAAELAEDDAYLAAIDAIAQEQTWFDGGADNEPPGDCPLPRTRVDVDTDEYRRSLSPECRRQFDRYPESTLHVSSEEYLEDLLLAQSKGVVIFTVDYALDPENIAWLFQTARGLGFIPFVSSRGLDRFVEPVP